MRLSEIILADITTLALFLSLGACSLSVSGSGPEDSGSSTAQSEQRDIQSIGSKDSPKADTRGAAATNFQSSSGGSAQATAAPGSKDDDKDDDKGGDDAPTTDSTWKDIQSTGQHTEVSGTYIVQGVGTALDLVGDLDALMVQGSDVKISTEDVDTLTVQGSNATVHARDVDHLNIQGSNVTVRWLSDDPTIQDGGANNTAGELSQ